MRRIILTFVRHYLPGYKAGGPVRTIANLVEQLGDEFDFRIVTLDRDAMDKEPYPGVTVDAWNRVGKAHVYYASKGSLTLRAVARLLRDTPYDVLYLNSFFDPRFTALPLLARRAGMTVRGPIVLAPRGQFSEGAVALKSWKKRLYIELACIVGLYRDLIWQASSEHEVSDVRRVLQQVASRIEVVPNLSSGLVSRSAEHKKAGALRVVFVSRITPMKNLAFALTILAKVCVPVEFSVAGPVSDERYWGRCKELIAALPENINVNVVGSVNHNQVADLLANNDLFFLPTRGENYGHVIAEALAVGTPVLIANTTPWRNLKEAGVGWDLSLDAEQLFVEAIEAAAAKECKEYSAWRQRVSEYAKKTLTDESAIQANRRLFLDTRNEES